MIDFTFNTQYSLKKRSIEELKKKLGKKDIILYGAGYLGVLVARALRKYGIMPIAFVDMDKSKWGAEIEDLKVYAPSQVPKGYQNICFIICMYQKGELFISIKQLLVQLGWSEIYHILEFRNYDPIFYDEYLLLNTNVETIIKNIHKVERVYNLLSDSISKQHYYKIFEFMLEDYNTVITSIPLDEQYFAYDIYKKYNKEVFIDCGAFDGTIMEQFLKNVNYKFDKYIAIEPDSNNLIRLQRKIATLPNSVTKRILTILSALSNKKEQIRLENIINMNSIPLIKGKIKSKAKTLDFILKNECPTFIKIDVEGFDKKVLEGAISTIEKFNPVIAVSVYHKAEHFWEIPLWIYKNCPGYKLYFRSYMNRVETICYAIPRHRQLP